MKCEIRWNLGCGPIQLFVITLWLSSGLCDKSFFISTESCPETKNDWQRRSLTFNCSVGMNYTCILIQKDLVETCIFRYNIPANSSGCPHISIRDYSTGPQLVPQTKYYPCPVRFPDCPKKTHPSYSVYELYLYPACIRKYRNESSTSSSTINSSNTSVNDNYGDGRKTVYIAVLIFAIAFLTFTFAICLPCIIWGSKYWGSRDFKATQGAWAHIGIIVGSKSLKRKHRRHYSQSSFSTPMDLRGGEDIL